MSMVSNKLPPMTLHPTLIIFALLSIVTGTFIQFFIIFFIVFIHELGHFMAARFYKWEVRTVTLWLFGGVMETEEAIKSPKQELIVSLFGPVQHIFLYGFIFMLQELTAIPHPLIDQMYELNTLILLFNLLPIYPLDGGKLLFLGLSLFFPFRRAYQKLIIASFVIAMTMMIGQILLEKLSLSSLLLFLFLIIELYRYWQEEFYTFIRFLLQRLTAKFPQKTNSLAVEEDERLIEVFERFKLNRRYDIYLVGKGRMSEKRALSLYFYEHRYRETMGELFK